MGETSPSHKVEALISSNISIIWRKGCCAHQTQFALTKFLMLMKVRNQQKVLFALTMLLAVGIDAK